MGAHKDPHFQRRSTESGTAFKDQCNIQLRSLGFTLLGPEYIKQAGIEVDQVAINRKARKIYFEFKGGYEGDRPGLIRTDTTKKVLCNAFLLHLCNMGPLVVITSAKPKEGLDSDTMIKRAMEGISGILFDIIELGNAEDRKRLKELLDMHDFSKPLLPLPVPKITVTEPGKAPSRPVASHDAVQRSWPPNLKVQDSSKRKRRKVSSKKAMKRAGEQIQLFEDEQVQSPQENDSAK